MVITQGQAVRVLERLKAKGVFFTVIFTKRTTGEKREMTCRGGVSAYVKGVGLRFDPVKKGLVSVWEASKEEGVSKAGAYRFIALEGLQEIRGQRKIYTVETL
jgi:hypothetical protein